MVSRLLTITAISGAMLGLAWVHRPHLVVRSPRPALDGPRDVALVRTARLARRWLRPPGYDRGDRLVAATMASVLALLLVHPLLGVTTAIAALAIPSLVRRQQTRRRAADVVRDLPVVIDLLRLALASAGSIRLALEATARAPQGPVGAAIAGAVERIEAGDRLVHALECSCAPLGPPVQPLVRALAAADRYGLSVAATLDRLGDEARRQRRRNAEAQARRVPVRLLLPLVMCVLPAFVLLTLVPVLSRTLLALDLG